MTTARRQQLLGRRLCPATVIIARGDDVRHFTIRPGVVGTVAALSLAVLAAGTALSAHPFAATGVQTAAQADTDLSDAYELRIASLRSEIERLTTRSFVDQKRVSSKVDILLDQQAELAERYARLQPLLDRAKSNGLIRPDATVPVPSARPTRSDPTATSSAGTLAYVGATDPAASARFSIVDRPGKNDDGEREATSDDHRAPTPDLIRQIGSSIDEVESEQIEGLSALTAKALERSDAIDRVFRTEGIDATSKPSTTFGTGGPFVPVPPLHRFEQGLAELEDALDRLQAREDASATLPLRPPVASAAVSSNFGVRADPFFGRNAMHTGIDFVAGTGTNVAAAAAGTVAEAGDNGGYGQMVEIDHGNGLSTRYAHLSAIAVRKGQTVRPGTVLGQVGSTGRSTGPHLHYEVRHRSNAVDPTRYLRAGRRIRSLG